MLLAVDKSEDNWERKVELKDFKIVKLVPRKAQMLEIKKTQSNLSEVKNKDT